MFYFVLRDGMIPIGLLNVVLDSKYSVSFKFIPFTKKNGFKNIFHAYQGFKNVLKKS